MRVERVEVWEFGTKKKGVTIRRKRGLRDANYVYVTNKI